MYSNESTTAKDKIEDALRDHGSTTDGRGKWNCPCPNHGKQRGDKNRSLDVKAGTKGAAVKCWVGCQYGEIMASLGLDESDGFDEPPNKSKPPPQSKEVAKYEYFDRHGEYINTKVRYEPKDFRWKLPGPDHRPECLFDASGVAEASHLHYCEGEKDALNLRNVLPNEEHRATTAANEWRDELVEFCTDKQSVAIYIDRDDAGRRKALKVFDSLTAASIAASLFYPKTTDIGSDVSDHIEAGFGLDDFVAVTADELRDELNEKPEDHDDTDSRKPRRYLHVGPDAYEALLDAPEQEWLVRDFLGRGIGTAMGGGTFAGKTFMGLAVGRSFAGGHRGWFDNPFAGQHRNVVYLGMDTHMTSNDVARRLFHLDKAGVQRGERPGAWMDHFFTIGSSWAAGSFPRSRYLLDAGGCARLREDYLSPIEKEHGPIDIIIDDTLSTSLPEGADEDNSNDMTQVVSELTSIAIDYKCAALTLHHPTKSAARDASGKVNFNSWDPHELLRGSGAIANCAGVVAAFFAPDAYPTLRLLKCMSNAGDRRKVWLEVAGEAEAQRGHLNYFDAHEGPESSKPLDDDAVLRSLAHAFRDPDQQLSQRQFTIATQRVAPGRQPSRAAKNRGEELAKLASEKDFLLFEGTNKRSKLRLSSNGKIATRQFRLEAVV